MACDTNTLLMLHMDGTNGSTTFTDSSTYGRTVTALGNSQISTTSSKFGSGCGLFDGTGDYLTIPDSADWQFAGNFTIDFQVRFASLAGTQGLWAQTTSGSEYVEFYWDGSNWVFKLFTGNVLRVSFSAADTLSTSTWYHVALIRGWGSNANTWEVARDGNSKGGTTTTFTYPDYTSNVEIGNNTQGGLGQFNGRLDEFRISNIARWTANFTPPTSAYCANLGTGNFLAFF